MILKLKRGFQSWKVKLGVKLIALGRSLATVAVTDGRKYIIPTKNNNSPKHITHKLVTSSATVSKV